MALNRFVIDVDNVDPVQLIPRNEYHDMTLNKPCNCGDCLAYALAFGIVRVEHVQNEDGIMMWVPDMMDNDTSVFCFSADHVRKTFASTHGGDIRAFASAMITNRWRAARKEMSGSRFHVFDKKRKAKEVISVPAKKPANAAMSPRSMMPSSASAATAAADPLTIDVGDEEE
jgi:hypothetical protein